MSDTAIDRFIYYHPDLARTLGIVDSGDNREKFASLLEEASEFLHRHELRPSNDKSVSMDAQATHTVYGGSVRTWFCSVSGKFKIDTCESVSRLNFISGQLFRIGCPLFLVECVQPDLVCFPLYLDVDITVSDDHGDARNFEQEFIGSDDTGYPLLASIVRVLYSVYPREEDLGELLVSSATFGKRISWRLVFPNLIVNSERLGILRDYIVQKLNHLSIRREEKTLKDFKDRLIALSPGNMFRTIIDESAAKSRHGIRMVFNDKVTEGKLENRPFKPLIKLVPKFEGEEKEKKFSSLISSHVTESPLTDMEWSRNNSLLWPSLTHRSLTEWTHQPSVRSSANIRTGPGGSSLCLSSMTVGDAVRAASRFQARQSYDKRKKFSAIYKWEEGSVASFKKRLPIGIAGKFEDQDSKTTWMLQSDLSGENVVSRSSVSFDETTFVLTVLSIDADEFKYLTRMINRRFPNVQAAAPQLAAGAAVDKPPTVDEKTPKNFVVLKTYRGEEPGELDVDEGEQVELVNHDASGWSAVKSIKTGKLGYVPATFIRAI